MSPLLSPILFKCQDSCTRGDCFGSDIEPFVLNPICILPVWKSQLWEYLHFSNVRKYTILKILCYFSQKGNKVKLVKVRHVQSLPLDPDYSGQQRWWHVCFHLLCALLEKKLLSEPGRQGWCSVRSMLCTLYLVHMAGSADRADSFQVPPFLQSPHSHYFLGPVDAEVCNPWQMWSLQFGCPTVERETLDLVLHSLLISSLHIYTQMKLEDLQRHLSWKLGQVRRVSEIWLFWVAMCLLSFNHLLPGPVCNFALFCCHLLAHIISPRN